MVLKIKDHEVLQTSSLQTPLNEFRDNHKWIEHKFI